MRKREHRYSRTIKKFFLVVCEGQTERAYVEYLKRLYRLPIQIVTKVSGADINNRRLQSYIQQYKIDKDDICDVFLMYDADVPSLIDKLQRINAHLILTNPCIELWFLLHVKNHTRSMSSDDVVNSLINSHPVWNSYKKGELSSKQISLLNENMKNALTRAGQFTRGQNPSTDIPDFINALEEEKKC